MTDPLPEPPHRRRYPSTIGGVLYILVLAAMAVGIGITWHGPDWRLGIRVVAGALAAAALLRLVLPQRDAGMLAVRPRVVDVLLAGSVSVVLFVLADNIPDQPS
ncbi:DUF3017 domain-containing protein [Nocardioides antri]|uniref:DUF3017 domain-containing protein n=1 Tax=Nocardioides antri TaxID=2607659 RepID=A0A5B1M489_9ACTN|nr:DUF3017 domain-containing protein [Nocardioides antri]KAA1427248.1 DUF3017 domain-containing protein [Nocardioides antri]